MRSSYLPPKRKGRTFYCYDPKYGRQVNLRTHDEATALRMQAEILKRAGVGGEPATVTQVPRTPSPPSQSSNVLDLDSSGADESPITADNLLSEWASNKSFPTQPNEPSAPQSPTPSPPPYGSATPAPVERPSPILSIVPSGPTVKTKRGMDPAKAMKIASGIKKVAANVNVLIDGAMVRMFGTNPAPPDEEEMEMLQTAWELVLDEYFAKSSPNPWILMGLANVMIIGGMWFNGTKIEKKLTAVDPTKAKSAPLASVPANPEPHQAPSPPRSVMVPPAPGSMR